MSSSRRQALSRDRVRRGCFRQLKGGRRRLSQVPPRRVLRCLPGMMS